MSKRNLDEDIEAEVEGVEDSEEEEMEKGSQGWILGPFLVELVPGLLPW